MTTHRVMTDGTLVSLSKKEKVSLVSFIYPPFFKVIINTFSALFLKTFPVSQIISRSG